MFDCLTAVSCWPPWTGWRWLSPSSWPADVSAPPPGNVNEEMKQPDDISANINTWKCSNKLGKSISSKYFFLFSLLACRALSCLWIWGTQASLPFTRWKASLCGSNMRSPYMADNNSGSPSRSWNSKCNQGTREWLNPSWLTSILTKVNIGDSRSWTSLSSSVNMSTVTSWSPMATMMSPAWE